jgi:hypothetical protein
MQDFKSTELRAKVVEEAFVDQNSWIIVLVENDCWEDRVLGQLN